MREDTIRVMARPNKRKLSASSPDPLQRPSKKLTLHVSSDKLKQFDNAPAHETDKPKKIAATIKRTQRAPLRKKLLQKQAGRARGRSQELSVEPERPDNQATGLPKYRFVPEVDNGNASVIDTTEPTVGNEDIESLNPSAPYDGITNFDPDLAQTQNAFLKVSEYTLPVPIQTDAQTYLEGMQNQGLEYSACTADDHQGEIVFIEQLAFDKDDFLLGIQVVYQAPGLQTASFGQEYHEAAGPVDEDSDSSGWDPLQHEMQYWPYHSTSANNQQNKDQQVLPSIEPSFGEIYPSHRGEHNFVGQVPTTEDEFLAYNLNQMLQNNLEMSAHQNAGTHLDMSAMTLGMMQEQDQNTIDPQLFIDADMVDVTQLGDYVSSGTVGDSSFNGHGSSPPTSVSAYGHDDSSPVEIGHLATNASPELTSSYDNFALPQRKQKYVINQNGRQLQSSRPSRQDFVWTKTVKTTVGIAKDYVKERRGRMRISKTVADHCVYEVRCREQSRGRYIPDDETGISTGAYQVVGARSHGTDGLNGEGISCRVVPRIGVHRQGVWDPAMGCFKTSETTGDHWKTIEEWRGVLRSGGQGMPDGEKKRLGLNEFGEQQEVDSLSPGADGGLLVNAEDGVFANIELDSVTDAAHILMSMDAEV